MKSKYVVKDQSLPPGYVEHEEDLLIPRELQHALNAKEAAEHAANQEAVTKAMDAREQKAAGTRVVAAEATTAVFDEPFQDASPRHKLLSAKEVEKFISNSERNGDADSRFRNKSVIKAVREKGQYRRLAMVNAGWRQDLKLLERRFPNFVEVIDYLRRAFAMAEAGDGSVRFTPIAVDGPPGCGKSLFAESLALLLGVPWRRINGEALQEGSALTGSADYWSNSKAGVVFDVLIDSDVAQPLMFVDELDKVGNDLRYDPRAGLYSLLEPGTAKTFRDLSVPALALDASRILWICTSNYYERIPEPIRSRLRLFRIPAPTPEQGKAIARNVYVKILHETGVERFGRMPEDVVEHVATLAPRQMRAAIHEALGSAVYSKRRKLLLADFPGQTSVRKPLSCPVGISLQPRLAIFLNVRGVLHPDGSEDWNELLERVEAGEPPKLQYVPALEKVLAGRPEVGIVLTATSRLPITPRHLELLMGGELAKQVIGSTPDLPVPLALRVAAYIAAQGVKRWIAIDDERTQWPVEMRDRVVVTKHRQGLGSPGALSRLHELLGVHGDH